MICAGFPLLSSDYSDVLSGSDYMEHENVERKKRDVQNILNDFGLEMEEREEMVEGSRMKRQTFVFVAKDEDSNSSTVREFTFSTVSLLFNPMIF